MIFEAQNTFITGLFALFVAFIIEAPFSDIMNKVEIAEILRKEVGELEVSINKLHSRCERLKRLVLDLEDEIAGPQPKTPQEDSKFRKVIDQVFGEKPKRPKG
jgi:hypothetical protein